MDDDLFAEIGDQYFLDFKPVDFDITTLGKVGIPSTNHNFADFCDYIIVSKIFASVIFLQIGL